MKAKQATQPETIKIAVLKRTASLFTIVGDSPLIVNAWSQKARMEMLVKHMGGALPRAKKNPYEDFLRTMYRFDDGNYGFPVVAFKEAMATVTADLPGAARSQVYRNISVTGRRGFQLAAFADIKSPHELAEIFSPNAPAMREDMVRTAGINRDPDIRYRAEFWPWAARFNVAYNQQMFDAENVMNLLAHAGFSVGVGEWRQEKGGSNGLFHAATVAEAAMVDKWVKAGPKEPQALDAKDWLRATVARETEVRGSAPDKAAKPNKTRGNGAAHLTS